MKPAFQARVQRDVRRCFSIGGLKQPTPTMLLHCFLNSPPMSSSAIRPTMLVRHRRTFLLLALLPPILPKVQKGRITTELSRPESSPQRSEGPAFRLGFNEMLGAHIYNHLFVRL